MVSTVGGVVGEGNGVSEGVSVGDSVVGMGTISVASLQLASSPMKRIAIKTQAHFLAPVGVIR